MSFLSNQQVDPLSGEASSFVNDNGFIGELNAARLFRLQSDMDPREDAVKNDLSVQPVAFDIGGSESHGFWYVYWFATKDQGLAAQDILGSEYPPSEFWRFVMRSDSIQNIPMDTLSKWRDNQIGESRTNMYGPQRHQLHLLSLVGAVASYATLLGYDVPKVQFNDLVSSDTQFTDELMNMLIGDPSVKASEVDNPLHYLNSVYGRQRAAVWAALGESDPSKYNAAYHVNEEGELVPTLDDVPNVTFTQSDKLARSLAIVHQKWSGSTWARLLFVEDPHVDADHDDKYPDQVPVIMELFDDKKSAVAAGQTELAKRGDSSESANGSVPSQWTADQWADEMTEIKAMLKDVKGKSAKRKKVTEYITAEYGDEEEFSASVDDVMGSL